MYKKALALSAALLASHVSMATPLDPSEKNIAQYFSTYIRDQYYLYADSVDAKLVWYVAKNGVLSSPGTAPIFNAHESVPSSAPWSVWAPGESQVSLSGSFDTTGNIADLRQLQEEAKDVLGGLRAAPAELSGAEVFFINNGIGFTFDGSNSYESDCKEVEIDIPGGPLLAPYCYITDDDGKEVGSYPTERAYISVPRGRTSASTHIPFQIVTFPDSVVSDDIRSNLSHDLNLYFSFLLQWDIEIASGSSVISKRLGTHLSISCVEGGFGESVAWADRPACDFSAVP